MSRSGVASPTEVIHPGSVAHARLQDTFAGARVLDAVVHAEYEYRMQW